ncbi:MAG TPA: hypothetical protein VGH59_09300 [Casimicrobiaceae bacterium]
MLAALSIATFSLPALADLYSETQMKPMTPETTAKMKEEIQAAKAKWATMTPEQKAAVTKSMKGKKIGELTAMERVAQNDDMTTMSKSMTAQMKSEWDAAKVSYDKMAPDQKAALRNAPEAPC